MYTFNYIKGVSKMVSSWNERQMYSHTSAGSNMKKSYTGGGYYKYIIFDLPIMKNVWGYVSPLIYRTYFFRQHRDMLSFLRPWIRFFLCLAWLEIAGRDNEAKS